MLHQKLVEQLSLNIEAICFRAALLRVEYLTKKKYVHDVGH